MRGESAGDGGKRAWSSPTLAIVDSTLTTVDPRTWANIIPASAFNPDTITQDDEPLWHCGAIWHSVHALVVSSAARSIEECQLGIGWIMPFELTLEIRNLNLLDVQVPRNIATLVVAFFGDTEIDGTFYRYIAHGSAEIDVDAPVRVFTVVKLVTYNGEGGIASYQLSHWVRAAREVLGVSDDASVKAVSEGGPLESPSRGVVQWYLPVSESKHEGRV